VNLSGKVFIVTGAFGALGRAVTACMIGHGARLALVGKRPGSGVQYPAGALLYTGIDVSQTDAASAVAKRIFDETGRIDGLVNLAGGFHSAKLQGGTLESWDSMFRINLLTAVASCEAVVPYMLRNESGTIVNIGSLGAVKAACGMGAYAASKAGVVKLTEALADELKDRGITVNAILPGVIDTPRNRADMPAADFTRWVSANEIAEVIVFLVSDLARGISGATLPVNGRA
jgi:NAD(P)-dependent dehydrogenase (short-subunit alcohol dehydrogenase family)